MMNRAIITADWSVGARIYPFNETTETQRHRASRVARRFAAAARREDRLEHKLQETCWLAFQPVFVTREVGRHCRPMRRVGVGACAPDLGDPVPLWLRNSLCLCASVAIFFRGHDRSVTALIV